MSISFSNISVITARSLVAAENNILTRNALMDPVTKLRVSTPQALIDTDFEYGPQTSKWETYESFANYGAFYKSDSDSNIPVSLITKVNQVDNNTDVMEVTTLGLHGFRKGDAFVLQGTRSITTDGTFNVHFVIDAQRFTFIAKEPQTLTTVNDSLTKLFPARAYQGSMPSISSISTDGLSPSTLTVQTAFQENALSLGTDLLILRTRGRKIIDFDATADVQGAANDAAGWNRYIRSSNHRLSRGELLTYRVANGSTALTNLVADTQYQVFTVTQNRIQLASPLTPTTRINIETGTATGIHSLESLVLGSADGVYKITQQVNTNQYRIQLPFRVPQPSVSFTPKTSMLGHVARFFIPNHGLDNSTVTYSQGSSAAPITGLTNNATYTLSYIDSDTFSLSGRSNLVPVDGTHSFTSSIISGRTVVANNALMVEGFQSLSSTGYNFFSTFRKNDSLTVEETVPQIKAVKFDVSNIVANEIFFNSTHGLSNGTLLKYTQSISSSFKVARTLRFLNIGSPGNTYLNSPSGDYNVLFNKYGVGVWFPIEYNNTIFLIRFNSAFSSQIRNTSFQNVDGSTPTSADIPTGVVLSLFELLPGYTEPIPQLTKEQIYVMRGVNSNSITLHQSYADAINNLNIITVTTGNRGLGGGTFANEDMHILASTNAGDSSFVTLIQPPALQASWTSYNSNALSSSNIFAVKYFTRTGETAMPGFSNNFLYYLRGIGGAPRVALYNSFADASNLSNKLWNATPTGYIQGLNPQLTMTTPIDDIVNNIQITMSNPATFTSTAANIVATSAMTAASKGLVVHRPFDGGVEIIPSPYPNSALTRQTRRYFRYQSGKGIQMSMGTNFSGYTDIDSFTSNGVITTRSPHRLQTSNIIVVEGVNTSQSNLWNKEMTVSSVVGERVFTVPTITGASTTLAPGFPKYYVKNWSDSVVRVGMFDDQNGLFFEYDGSNLHAVRRSSIQQLPGTLNVTQASNRVTATNTLFTSYLQSNQTVVIRGMPYRIASVASDTEFRILPAYRGPTVTNVIGSLVQDTRVPQSAWNLDRCDGTSNQYNPSGYNLNINRMQMVYIDYSWYGAGKARFGFKGTDGNVMYVHEFLHNNLFDTAYMRSGNLPARYEVVNLTNPTYTPKIMHWGTSVIMDGNMDQDKAYFFTINGKTLAFGNGDLFDFQGTYTSSNITNRIDASTGTTVSTYTLNVAAYSNVQSIRSGTYVSNATVLPSDTQIISIVRVGNGASLFINKRPLVSTSGTVYTFSAGNPNDSIPSIIPLVSMRLAPSVDNGYSSDVIGGREIVNRMQLQPLSVDVLTTHDVDITILLNGYPANRSWQQASSPSLAQVLYHSQNDTIMGGTPLFSFRASGGTADSTGKRAANTVTKQLDNLTPIGNSLVAGDDVFPNGPDILTIVASLIDNTGITSTTPFTVSARLSWTESQA